MSEERGQNGAVPTNATPTIQPLQQPHARDSNDEPRVLPEQQTAARQAQTRPPVPETPDPLTDLQQLAKSSTGELLPIFGRDLFRNVPSTFAPGNEVAVAPDYEIAPGDEILLRIWGPESYNGQLGVDRAGSIYIPRVGAVHVAGLRFADLQKHINTEVGRIYRNFELSVNLGQLRSVQIYVVGEARHPGAYTVSSLSTVLNALFASGGPNAQGSFRRIQLRRTGEPAAEFDLYDFLLHGDKSQDIRLQTGDTIFIPPVGLQVAVAGSVRHPAIYEVKSTSTLASALEIAGGLSTTASDTSISLERIDADQSRKALNIALDGPGRGMVLRDGDVIFVNHIAASYEKTVSIRGNLANPGRFPWHEGMRLSEIIPDKTSLLTSGYWEERSSLGVPAPLFSPADNSDPTGSSTPTADLSNRSTQHEATSPQTRATVADSAIEAQHNSTASSNAPENVIRRPAPEIDWSYAVIERLDTQDLKNVLIPFNLGRLVEDHDPSQNLELHPGDIVTILSQRDIRVAREQQTKYVRLEGEFVSSGVYSVKTGETLMDIVQRAGGLTAKAYLYGSSFTRESARVFQQQRLDEYVAALSADMERSIASRAVASSTGGTDQTAIAEQRLLIDQLKQARSSGRVVLEFNPDSLGVESVPNLALEDGDVFRVPPVPSTVSVVGAVYGQNVFLYNHSRNLNGYLALAGKPNRIADRKHEFIIRADGSIYSRDSARGNFDMAHIFPGDSIVIPEKLIKPPILRQIVDYSQILSSFGVAAAAVDLFR